MHPQKGLVAQLNSASDYGSEGSRFESWRGHRNNPQHTEYKVIADFLCFGATGFLAHYIVYVEHTKNLKLLWLFFIVIIRKMSHHKKTKTSEGWIRTFGNFARKIRIKLEKYTIENQM